MALSKTNSTTPAVVTLMPAVGAVEIIASIDAKNMSHVINRLTNLYGDAVLASVRETISNATDASSSIAPADRKPVEVLTSNALQKNFVVRDHGVGMSTHKVQTVFANYAASLKGDDIDAIGSYGLGGKAPLAYTDAFDVVTTHDGITTSFTMAKSNGLVKTNIRSVVKTGEPSGTEVTIPVAANDIDRFVQAMDIYKQHSHIEPIIVDDVVFHGNSNYLSLGDAVLFEDEDDKILGKVFIRQDSVAEYFKFVARGYSISGMAYSLAGWLYSSTGVDSGDLNPIFVVELTKSALLNFASSRDSITNDDKLSELNNRVAASLQDPSFTARALEIFRSLSRGEIARILPTMKSALEFTAAGKFSIGYGQPQHDIIELTNTAGFNPFSFNNLTVAPSFTLALSMSQETISLYYELNNRSALREDSMSRVNKILEIFSREEAVDALSLSRIGVRFFGTKKSIFAVTETSEVLFKSLLRNRNALFAGGRSDFIFVFSSKPQAKIDKEDIAYASTIIGEQDLTFMTAKALLAMIKPDIDYQRSLRVPDLADRESEIMSGNRHLLTPRVDNFNDVVKTSTTYTSRSSYGNFNDVMESDAILIIGKNWSTAFIGMLNAGHNLKGKEVIVYDKKLIASEAKKLMAYKDRIFFTTSAELSTALTKELAEGKVFHGTALNTVLAATSFEALIANVVGYGMSSLDHRSLVMLKEYLNKEDSIFMEVFDAFLLRPKISCTISPPGARAELNKRYGAEYVKAIEDTTIGLHSSMHSSAVVESTAARTVLEAPNKDELVITPLIEEVFKYVASILAKRRAASPVANDIA